MIALRDGLTLEAFGDVEGYCCIFTGLDDKGQPIYLRLGQRLAATLVEACEAARREHEVAKAGGQREEWYAGLA